MFSGSIPPPGTILQRKYIEVKLVGYASVPLHRLFGKSGKMREMSRVAVPRRKQKTRR